MSYDSLLQSFQKVCILVTFAYLLSRMGFLRRLFELQQDRRDKIGILLLFIVFGVVEFILSPEETPGSSRIVAVTVAGLLAGPWIGIGVALVVGITGLVTLGPQAAYTGLAAAVGGVLGGWVSQYRPHLQLRVLAGFVVGALSHTIWMGLVFIEDTLIATWDAIALFYGVPVIMNGMAVALFLMIVGDMRAQQERIERTELARALNMGNRVLPHLKYGLNAQSAGYIAEIIRRITGVSSVTITDAKCVLASTADGSQEFSELAKQAITSKSPVYASDVSASPLFYQDQVIGCVELRQKSSRISQEVAQLGSEVAQFLGTYQLQLWHLERQSEMASKAELRALQAQVHPHFLFNALNTLASLCETNPRKAADIAIKLGAYYRTTLSNGGGLLVRLSEELANVRHYLEIEKARFGDRLMISEQISNEMMNKLVPTLSIQPLVENAVLHGLSTKAGKGKLNIVIRMRKTRLTCTIIDDGIGFVPKPLDGSTDNGEPHGLTILHSRLDRIFHGDFRLRLRSRPGKGTVVMLSIPDREDHHARNHS